MARAVRVHRRAPRGGEPGSNGLLLDRDGKLVLCQRDDRRVARLEASLDAPQPIYSTVADRFAGKRFNSPNDVALHSSGALYFTDPPYGLAGGPADPARELPFSGVYRIGADGEVTLLTDQLSRPNGIDFSPDERTLYVANSDPDHAVWMAYPAQEGGTLGDGEVFSDATPWVPERPVVPDGLEVDALGNLFATGPGGVLELSPDGRRLGTLLTGQPTANCAFDHHGRRPRRRPGGPTVVVQGRGARGLERSEPGALAHDSSRWTGLLDRLRSRKNVPKLPSVTLQPHRAAFTIRTSEHAKAKDLHRLLR